MDNAKVNDAIKAKEAADNVAKDVLMKIWEEPEIKQAIKKFDLDLYEEAQDAAEAVRVADNNFLRAIAGR